MKHTKRLLALGLTLAMLVGIPALASELTPDLEPIYVGRATLEAVPENWNPLGEEVPGRNEVLLLTAEPLYRQDETGAYLPAQAAAAPLDLTAEYAGSYGIPEYARRGYAFAIDIREGAAWEDGKSVSGADWYFTVEKWLEAGRFPLEIANYQAFLRGDTKPAEEIVSLMEAGFSSVGQAEEAGHRDFYMDVTHFWGLDAGWLRITDATPLKDEAIPSGCEEMYLTAAYIYQKYLSETGSLSFFQREFVGIPATEGEKLTAKDVGLIAEENRIVIILQEPAAPGYVMAALAELVPLRPSVYGDAYGTAGHYHSCGPYRILSAEKEEMILEPNPHWTGEPVPVEKLICRGDG